MQQPTASSRQRSGPDPSMCVPAWLAPFQGGTGGSCFAQTGLCIIPHQWAPGRLGQRPRRLAGPCAVLVVQGFEYHFCLQLNLTTPALLPSLLPSSSPQRLTEHLRHSDRSGCAPLGDKAPCCQPSVLPASLSTTSSIFQAPLFKHLLQKTSFHTSPACTDASNSKPLYL